MSQTDWENMPKKLKEEKITNRVLINFGFVLLGYVILYILYLYATGSIGIDLIQSYPYVMLGIMIATLAGMAACYILAAKKKPALKNYGHMLLGVSVVAFYLNFAFYTRWLMAESLPGFLSDAVTFLKNTKNAYIVTALSMLAYIVIVIIYNNIILYRKPKKTSQKNKGAKKKK